MRQTMEGYHLNKDYKISSVFIAEINETVIIIDDFLHSLEPIYQFATETAYFQPFGSDGTLYPGKRDEMPAPYYRAFEQLINELLEQGIITSGENNLYLHRCKLSLVTQNADELNTLQRMPHIDSTDDKTFAAVHYLSAKEWGGTGIYKYRPDNIIKVTADNQNSVHKMIADTKKHSATHQGYLNETTELFEKVVNIEAKVNRLVIYKSNLLHSAALFNNKKYNNDINNSRLSISSFFRIN
ncbi:DUF6445 family protein [Pseudoalteromonas lipolytica]|uniref:DUF6445 family protein n=2 Tax=Pseudoalteromonas TaxID=53246 RepID=UPI00309D92E4